MKGMYLQITYFPAVNCLRAAHLVSYYNYEGGSIYNGNTFITPHTNAPELYTLYEKKEQVFTFRMVHKTLLYLNYLFNYRLLKEAHT